MTGEIHDGDGREPVGHLDSSIPPIARLPVELVDAIVDNLAPNDRVFLSQTCRWMRVLARAEGDLDAAIGFLHSYDPRPPHHQAARRMNFLAVLARDRPHQWVCEVCGALHPVHTDDTPIKRVALKGTEGLYAPLLEDRFYGPRHAAKRATWWWSKMHGIMPLQFHHVQLALKYTRLRAEHAAQAAEEAEGRGSVSRPPYQYQDYLRRLMAPVHIVTYAAMASPHRFNCMANKGLADIRMPCSFYPKIVLPNAEAETDTGGGRPRPRFLLLSVYRCASIDDSPFTFYEVGWMMPCPHMVKKHGPADRAGRPWWWAGREARRKRGLGRNEEWHSLPTLSNLSEAVYDALHGEGGGETSEIRGTCPRCPMDFEVRTTDRRRALELRFWKDLGPEGSAADDAWQIHLSGHCAYSIFPSTFMGFPQTHELNQGGAGRMVVPHAAGSVRALYESAPCAEYEDGSHEQRAPRGRASSGLRLLSWILEKIQSFRQTNRGEGAA